MVHYVDYRPLGAMLQMWHCTDREILIDGPAGTGKTRGILENVVAMADLFPRSRQLVMRKTRVSMTETTLNTLEQLVLLPDDPSLYGPGRAHRTKYVRPNKSEIVIAGMDEPQRLFSSEYDRIFVDECRELELESWESLHRALRWKHMQIGTYSDGRPRYLQQLIGACNPGPPSSWVLKRSQRGIATRFISRHTDNPSLDPDYLEALDKKLTGVTRKRLFLGEWIAEEGQVYEMWDEALHIIPAPPTLANGRADYSQLGLRWYFGSIDWGHTKPGSLQVWGVDFDGRLFLVKESYRTKMSKDWWAERACQADDEFRLKYIVADPEDPGSIRLFRDYMIKKNSPCVVREAENSVMSGIEHVRVGLNPENPRLFLVRGYLQGRDPELDEAGKPCCLEEEIPRYVYPKSEEGKPVKEKPDSICEDHACDAMRYAAVSAWGRNLEDASKKSKFQRGSYGDVLGHAAIIRRMGSVGPL